MCVLINGAGSAGIAIGNHLMDLGVEDLIMVDRFGIICDGMENLSPAHQEVAQKTNLRKVQGTLADAMKDADVFIGISALGMVSKEMVVSMAMLANNFEVHTKARLNPNKGLRRANFSI